jgi:hypothetical protein
VKAWLIYFHNHGLVMIFVGLSFICFLFAPSVIQFIPSDLQVIAIFVRHLCEIIDFSTHILSFFIAHILYFNSEYGIFHLLIV